MPVSYQHLKFEQLSSAQQMRWRALRQGNPELYSPFLSYEFVAAAAQFRKNCHVVLAEQGSEIIGFLPYELEARRAYPVARQINDAQAIIALPNTDLHWLELLQVAQVDCYPFHALVGNIQPDEQSAVFGTCRSFLCDINRPPEGYLKWLKRSSKTVAKQQQKTNKLIREIGPLRWDFDNRDRSLLTRVLDLKSAQYLRTNIFDKFSVGWIRQLMHELLESSGPVRGQLSLLWAGQELVAGHFGLREGSLLHYWFPVYDPYYEIYSPGTALFVELVRCSADLGIDKIDYGYGDIPYKHKLCNVITQVHQGAFCRSSFQRQRLRMYYHAALKLKRFPAKELLKKVRRRFLPNWGARQHGI